MVATATAAVGTSGAQPKKAAAPSVNLNIAVVSNPDMIDMEQLTPYFEKANPGITVHYSTTDEITEETKVNEDAATGSGLYDIAMTGSNELPVWANNGWAIGLNQMAKSTPGYDVADLLPAVRAALSINGQLYAVPFYAESSFLMYRKDLFKAAGLTMPAHPTWNQIALFAKKLNDPSKGVAGICLRGEAGWGEALAALTTVVHAFGGEMYNKNYVAEFTSPAFEKAMTFYVNLIRNYGEPAATSDSFTQCLSLFSQGKAAMWYDATVAASQITDPATSKVAHEVGFAPAPSEAVNSGGWLYSWSLSIVKGSKHMADAWKFLDWATSKAYIQLVAQKLGANLIPPGTRISTYSLPAYLKAASSYAALTLYGINHAETTIANAAPLERSFYMAIPQWEEAGNLISNYISAAIAGQTSVSQALSNMQSIAQLTVDEAGYHK